MPVETKEHELTPATADEVFVPLSIPSIEPLASRIRKWEPESVLRWFPLSLIVAAALVAVVVWLQRLQRLKYPYSSALLWCCGAAVIVGVLLAILFRTVRVSKRWDFAGFKAYTLAIGCGIVMLALPAYLGVWRSSDADRAWLIWGFLDKRWLVSLYWLAVAAFVVFPAFFIGVLRGIIRPPESAPMRVEPSPPGSQQRWLVYGAKTLIAIAMAWFYAGPPWNLATQHRVIDFHEQVHLGPLQAIDKGYVPYLGPASTHYGPGSQLFMYAYMKLSGQFTVVGFRNANAAIHFLAVLIFSVLVFHLLKAWEGTLVMALAMTYSPFHLLTFVGGSGSLDGFYGWTNDLRYLGVFVLAICIPFLLRRWKEGFPNYPALFLGLVWGVFTWMAQENFVGGVAASVLLLFLLWITGTAPERAIAQVAGSVAIGCGISWAPSLVYYILHDALFTYLRWYFLYPSAVSAGYSNTYWAEGPGDPQYRAFLLTGVVVVLITVLTLYDVTKLRLRSQLTSRQTLLLAASLALAASYQSSLFRSDGSHLLNTLTALPLVIYLSCADLPAWTAPSSKPRARLRTAMVVLFLVVFPIGQYLKYPYNTLAEQQMARFKPSIQTPAPPFDSRVAFQRATQYLSDEPQGSSSDAHVSMRELLQDMSAIRDVVGTRKTLVLSYPVATADLVLFLADLRPAPYLIDEEMMVLDTKLQQEVEVDFAKRATQCQAVIGTGKEQSEVRSFFAAHPGAQTITRSIGQKPYFIFLAEQPGTQRTQ